MPAVSVVVLSGKGGTAKTAWQTLMAGEASRYGLSALLIDADPEQNLSNRFDVPRHSTGLGNVFEEAGLVDDDKEPDMDRGVQQIQREIIPTKWDGVELIPAGASLAKAGVVHKDYFWWLREFIEQAELPDRYDLILLDTAGRTGPLVSLAMYAADVAYAPIVATTDAIRKATEAKSRLESVQRAHPELRWAGVVLSGFDTRTSIEEAIRQRVYEQFGDEVRAEVPRRAAVNEAFQLGDRLGDLGSAAASSLARIFLGFLLRDLLQRSELPAGVPTEGAIR